MSGIVHTCQLFVYFSKLELQDIEKNFSDKMVIQSDKKFTIEVDNIKFTFLRTSRIVFIQFSCISLLNKSLVTESDLNDLNVRIINAVKYFTNDYNKELTLKRFDYRYDAYIPDEDIRNLLFKLYAKTTYNHGRAVKISYIKINSIRYQSKSTHKSVMVNIYDKSQWSSQTQKPIELYEEDVIRYEVQLLNRHLNYKKQKNFSKDLETYLTKTMFIKYFSKYVIPIFYTGDYYDIYEAKKIIRKTYKNSCTSKKLVAFLTEISNDGISQAKSKLSKYLFKTRINELNLLNINPILIPKQDKITHLKNPLSELKNLP